MTLQNVKRLKQKAEGSDKAPYKTQNASTVVKALRGRQHPKANGCKKT